MTDAMTGPEHYREAERLLDHARDYTGYDAARAAAQVHATLALAAATALQFNKPMTMDRRAWWNLCATPLGPAGGDPA